MVWESTIEKAIVGLGFIGFIGFKVSLSDNNDPKTLNTRKGKQSVNFTCKSLESSMTAKDSRNYGQSLGVSHELVV